MASCGYFFASLRQRSCSSQCRYRSVHAVTKMHCCSERKTAFVQPFCSARCSANKSLKQRCFNVFCIVRDGGHSEWHIGFKIWQVPSLAKWAKIKISQYHWTICINHKSFGWYNLWNKNHLSFKCGTIIQWSLRMTHMLQDLANLCRHLQNEPN